MTSLPSFIWGRMTFPSYPNGQYPNGPGASYYLTEHTVTIGRSWETNIRIDDQIETISQNHCTLTYNSKLNVCNIIDTSTHGTWVNHERLVQGKPTQIKHRDLIVLGCYTRISPMNNHTEEKYYFIFKKTCNLFLMQRDNGL